MDIFRKLFHRRADFTGFSQPDRITECQGCGKSFKWDSTYWTLGSPDCPKCGYNNKKMMNATQNLEPAIRSPEHVNSGTNDAFNDINANNIKVSCRRCGAMIQPSTSKRTGGLCMPCANGTRQETDSAKNKVPSGPLSDNEVNSISYWSQVAFAVRCLQRAQPAYKAITNQIGIDKINLLDNAILIAENASKKEELPSFDLNSLLEGINKITDELGGDKFVSGALSQEDFARAAILAIESTIRLLLGPNTKLTQAVSNFSVAAISFNYDTRVAQQTMRMDFDISSQYGVTHNLDKLSTVPSNTVEPQNPENALGLEQYCIKAGNAQVACHEQDLQKNSEQAGLERKMKAQGDTTMELVQALGEIGAVSVLLQDVQGTDIKTVDGISVYQYGRGSQNEVSANLLLKLVHELNDVRALVPLQEALHHTDSFTRRVAFVALCEGSAHLKDVTTAVVALLVDLQPEIDTDMCGKSLVSFGGDDRSASRELIILLEQLESLERPEPFLVALRSTSLDVVDVASKYLVAMKQAENIVDAVKDTDLSAERLDTIVAHLEPELALRSLVRILREGSPVARASAARALRGLSDERATIALSEWDSFLKETLPAGLPQCHRCDREAFSQLADHSYWCSWCSNSFTLGDAYVGEQRRRKESADIATKQVQPKKWWQFWKKDNG